MPPVILMIAITGSKATARPASTCEQHRHALCRPMSPKGQKETLGELVSNVRFRAVTGPRSRGF